MSREVFQRRVTRYVPSQTGTSRVGIRTDCLPSEAAELSSRFAERFWPLVSDEVLALDVSSAIVPGLDLCPGAEAVVIDDFGWVTFFDFFDLEITADQGFERDCVRENSFQVVTLVSRRKADSACFAK